MLLAAGALARLHARREPDAKPRDANASSSRKAGRPIRRAVQCMLTAPTWRQVPAAFKCSNDGDHGQDSWRQECVGRKSQARQVRLSRRPRGRSANASARASHAFTNMHACVAASFASHSVPALLARDRARIAVTVPIAWLEPLTFCVVGPAHRCGWFPQVRWRACRWGTGAGRGACS